VGVPFPPHSPNKLGGGDYLCRSRNCPLDTKALAGSLKRDNSGFQTETLPEIDLPGPKPILFAPASRADYNRLNMDALMHLLAPVLEAMFFIGMAGSALVIVISAVEDVVTILEKD
jgi:hypothetical protein